MSSYNCIMGCIVQFEYLESRLLPFSWPYWSNCLWNNRSWSQFYSDCNSHLLLERFLFKLQKFAEKKQKRGLMSWPGIITDCQITTEEALDLVEQEYWRNGNIEEKKTFNADDATWSVPEWKKGWERKRESWYLGDVQIGRPRSSCFPPPSLRP